jgi:uncharacterized protein with HEPN domain
MSDDLRKHLFDILEAAEEIESFVQGMDFAAYQKNVVTKGQWRGISRLLERH